MKRGFILLIAMVLFSSYAYALTVTLSEPIDGQIITTTRNVTFKCQSDEIPNSLKLYHDINGWAENQTNSSVVLSGIDYSFVTINNIENGNYKWNCLSSNETISIFSSSNFTFTINIPNKAPTYTAFPDMSWPEDSVEDSLYLSSYFTDPDGDSLNYYSSEIVNVRIDLDNSTGRVTITPNGNYTGAFSITFTANDGSLTNTSNSILLNITPVDDLPYLIKEIPNQSWNYENELELDLSEYFNDIDSNLSYSATEPINIDINFNNEKVTFKAKNDWTGSTKIILKASDESSTTSSNEITLKVIRGNLAPEIESSSPSSNPRLTTSENFTFSIIASDPNNDSLQIQWYLNEAVIEGETQTSYDFKPTSSGTHKLKVVVSDGSKTAFKEWNLIVTSGAQEETLEGRAKQDLAGLCGNNEVDSGEGCNTCPQDVKCLEGEICSDNKCVLEEQSNAITLIIIITIMVIATLGAIVFLHLKHKRQYYVGEESENLESSGSLNDSKIKRKSEPGLMPSVEIDDVFPDKRKDMGEEKHKKRKTVGKVILKNYINTCMSKGISLRKIKSNLLEKGWDKKEVEEALLKFELKKK